MTSLPGFTDHYAEIDGIKLHYVRGGSGEPLILLPGWPFTWWNYKKIMPELAKSFDVIVVDYRGMGSSDKPQDGYDKKTMALDISSLVKKLQLPPVNIAGHDIGGRVAFSFAANHPDQTAKLIMLDITPADDGSYQLTLVPQFGSFDGDRLNVKSPYLWWWSFFQLKELGNKLLEGRMHFVLDWFYENTLLDQANIDKKDRAVFQSHYGTNDGIRAGNAWFQNFARDIHDQKSYALLEMPVLGIVGAKGVLSEAMGNALSSKVKNLKMLKAANSFHYPASEEPEFTAKAITDFIKGKKNG